MTITQEDVQWTVELWKDIWIKQGKQFISGRIIDPKKNSSLSIEKFIDGFVMLGGLGSDWKSEMLKFHADAITDIEDAAKAVAVEKFVGGLNKINWTESKLEDSNQNIHKYVLESDHQVVTESVGSFFVWDKSTGACLIQGCEEVEMLISTS